MRPVELLGPCGPLNCWGLRPGVSPPRVSPWAMVRRAYSPAGYVPFGPGGPLVCWCGYPCRGVLHTPHRAPPSVANVPPRYVHSLRAPSFGSGGPFGLLVRVPVRPGVSPRAMVRRPYRPLRVRPVRARGPVWFVGAGTRVGAYCIRPTGRHHRWRMCHRGTCIRYVRRHSGPEARLVCWCGYPCAL